MLDFFKGGGLPLASASSLPVAAAVSCAAPSVWTTGVQNSSRSVFVLPFLPATGNRQPADLLPFLFTVHLFSTLPAVPGTGSIRLGIDSSRSTGCAETIARRCNPEGAKLDAERELTCCPPALTARALGAAIQKVLYMVRIYCIKAV